MSLEALQWEENLQSEGQKILQTAIGMTSGLSNDLGKHFDPIENRRNSYGLTCFLVQSHHGGLTKSATFQTCPEAGRQGDDQLQPGPNFEGSIGI
jgi:hypothetical protein